MALASGGVVVVTTPSGVVADTVVETTTTGDTDNTAIANPAIVGRRSVAPAGRSCSPVLMTNSS